MDYCFLRGSRCLVTGGAGFIGHQLIKKLAGIGAEIRGTVYKKKPIFLRKMLIM